MTSKLRCGVVDPNFPEFIFRSTIYVLPLLILFIRIIFLIIFSFGSLADNDDEQLDEREYDEDEDENNRNSCTYYDDGDDQQDNGGMYLRIYLS